MKPAQQRAETIRGLIEHPLDVLVIGGGIVGAGVVRDAAMRGLRAGLVEQHDFAFGTSSRSSRLLHGGLRYLAQGRVGLVREASAEKRVLHSIAPHLAEPLPFIFPCYRGNREWLLWQLKIGVKLYDLLCGGRNLGRSSWLAPDETLGKVPGLLATELQGAVRYYDGFTQDARLTLDTLRSAARHGALLLNYCRFAQTQETDAGHTHPPARPRSLWRCQARDQETGILLEISARSVVNATGPWAEGLPHSQVKLRLTKGVHLVVRRTRLPVTETVVMTEGKRILFAIPWGERTIIGTTDTDYEGPPEAVRAEAADVDYVLGVTNRFFPNARLSGKDIISTWAGLRPLIANPNGSPSDISRSHEIRSPEPGWWDVAGGKLTTYRLMGEQTVDRVVAWLQRKTDFRGDPRRCRTAVEPLLPESEVRGLSGVLPPEFSRAVVEHCVTDEWALHLEDILVRRTGWDHYFADRSEKAGQVAEWMAELLEWPDSRRAAELERYVRASDSTPSDCRAAPTGASPS